VAYHDGSLAGGLGAVPKKFKVGDRVVFGTHELDMMVRKEFRDRGTFFELFRFRLSRARELGIAMSFGMNDRLLRAFAERFLGYRDVDMVPRFVRIVDPAGFARGRLGGRLSGLVAAVPLTLYYRTLDWVSFLWSRISCRGYSVEPVERFSHEFDDLWRRVASCLDVAVVRDSEYLNWRYADNPVRDFSVLAARDRSGTICGFIVYTELEGPDRQGIILELVTAPGRGRASRLLLGRALSDLKRKGMTTAVSWSFPEQRNTGAFRSAGFVMQEQNLFLQIRGLTGDVDPDILADRRNWFISIGDNDAYYGSLI
jgi:hypothetical protein